MSQFWKGKADSPGLSLRVASLCGNPEHENAIVRTSYSCIQCILCGQSANLLAEREGEAMAALWPAPRLRRAPARKAEPEFETPTLPPLGGSSLGVPWVPGPTLISYYQQPLQQIPLQQAIDQPAIPDVNAFLDIEMMNAADEQGQDL